MFFGLHYIMNTLRPSKFRYRRPTHIRVIDINGNELSLPTEDYEQRAMPPTLIDLPWQSEFNR